MISVDVNKSIGTNNRYWEMMVGSGQAYLALRQDYRDHLRDAIQNIGFKYIRFHGIFDENVGVYDENTAGESIYNFMQLDAIYDFLLESGVKPCVEFGFMPEKLKSADDYHFRWRYRVNVSPPKCYNKWSLLIKNTVLHWVDRYGLEEVKTWYFEVWNEPDLPQFWASTMDEYCKLYDVTAKAVKDVNKSLRVGGPSTTRIENAIPFLKHCKNTGSPLDFFSMHTYCSSWFLDGDGIATRHFQGFDKYIARVREPFHLLKRMGFEDTPIFITEWNSTPSSRDHSHDMPFIAAFICNSIKECYGYVDAYSYWTFTDVFEERGPGDNEFHGGFGLVTVNGIRKPSFNAYKMLHRLAHNLLYIGKEPVIITADEKGNIQILVFNYKHPDTSKCFVDNKNIPTFNDLKNQETTIEIRNLKGDYKITHYAIDENNGNAYGEWVKKGSKQYLKTNQINELKKNMDITLQKQEHANISNDFQISFELTPHMVKLVTLEKT